MELSQKRREEIYSAIHEQIMRLRIELQRDHNIAPEIDSKIAQTVNPIWRDAKSALNVEG